MKNRSPLLWVVSAPSGAGKTTLCNRLLERFPFIHYSVSCTTRPPRDGEVDGQHYHFLDETTFCQKIEAGAFLEHANVYGKRYGTLRETVLENFAKGQDVLMDLDVQGAELLRKFIAGQPEDDPIRRAHVDIFISPPSLDELEARLRGRKQDAEAVILRRLNEAAAEMECAGKYDYLLINDTLEQADEDFASIIRAEHIRNR